SPCCCMPWRNSSFSYPWVFEILVWRSVSRPLDRLEVDPLLVHFVERRHLAEPAHARDDEIGHVVDLFVGVESADAEADGRMSQLFANPHRAKDVARLEAGARARRTARHGHVFDGHHHRLALDEGE